MHVLFCLCAGQVGIVERCSARKWTARGEVVLQRKALQVCKSHTCCIPAALHIVMAGATVGGMCTCMQQGSCVISIYVGPLLEALQSTCLCLKCLECLAGWWRWLWRAMCLYRMCMCVLRGLGNPLVARPPGCWFVFAHVASAALQQHVFLCFCPCCVLLFDRVFSACRAILLTCMCLLQPSGTSYLLMLTDGTL